MIRPSLTSPRSRRAMTLTETAISAGMFAVVGVFVAYVTLAVAINSRDTLSQVPAQEQSYRTLDFVRSELLAAQFGTLDLSNDGSEVRFQNPRRTTISSIRFDGDKLQCVFRPNVNTDEGEVVWGRNVRGRFQMLGTPKNIRVQVTSTAEDRKRDLLRISYQDDLTIRN